MAQQSPRVVATIIWAALLAGPTVFLGVALFLVFWLRGGAGVGVPLAEPELMIGLAGPLRGHRRPSVALGGPEAARAARALLARPRGTLPRRPPLGAAHRPARWRRAEPDDPRLSRGRAQQPPKPLGGSEGRSRPPQPPEAPRTTLPFL